MTSSPGNPEELAMKNKKLPVLPRLMTLAAVLACGTFALVAQDPFSIPPAPVQLLPPSPLTQLAWRTEHQEASPKPSDLTADFTFAFTNISDSEIVIQKVKPSCSCTVAKLPAEPWHLPPHTNGEIGVSVNLKGKAGEFTKTLTVMFEASNVPPKLLTVTIKMPDRAKMRADNLQIAQADRQAVFKGDCAKCHAEPAKTLSGLALYNEVCGICHQARPRASMIPDLGLIKDHPTDYNFWKTNIAYGKPGSLMPAFAQSQGGPLTDKQIEELAQMLEDRFPYSRFVPRPADAGQIVNRAPPVQKN
jgi:mono/diheme cytochrome c family protein